MFNDNLLDVTQLSMVFSRRLATENNFSEVFSLKNTLVLSANIKGFSVERHLGKSFTYIKNNNGSKIESCTPHSLDTKTLKFFH